MRYIALDLGTSNTRLVAAEQGQIKIREFPSLLAYDDSKGWVIGQEAKKVRLTHTENVWSVLEVLKCKEPIVFHGRTYEKNVMLTVWFKLLKQQAEQENDGKCDLLTIIASDEMSYHQKEDLRNAAHRAGITHGFRFLNPAVCTALQYMRKIRLEDDTIVLVCDIGSGSTDFAVANIGDGVLEVCGTHSVSGFSGNMITKDLLLCAEQYIQSTTGTLLPCDDDYMAKMEDSIEYIKPFIPALGTATVAMPEGGVTSAILTFDEIKSSISRRKQYLKEGIQKVLELSGVSFEEVSLILLTGGVANMQGIVNELRSCFWKVPILLANPTTSAAEGAALEAGILDGREKDLLLMEVTKENWGIISGDGWSEMLIPKARTIPTCLCSDIIQVSKEKQNYLLQITAGKEIDPGMNPVIGEIYLDKTRLKQFEYRFCVKMDSDAGGIIRWEVKPAEYKEKDKRRRQEEEQKWESAGIKKSLTPQKINKSGIRCYKLGEAVPGQYRAAFELFEQAAELGLAEAQYNLGMCYLHGKGTAMDKYKAKSWIMKAAERGYQPAVEWYEKVCTDA